MDHSRAPVLEALAAYHAEGQMPFTPPGHKQGRGADPRVREALGDEIFRADVLATAGLDDRTSSRHVLQRAEALMADAVHADHTFFSTCGSSLSVKAAMLAAAGPHEKLVVSRDAHKSVVSGLILAGIRPVWVEPQWDADLHLAHPPAPASYEAAFEEHPDARGALVTSPTPYGTTADLAEIVRIGHARDLPVIVDEAWGAHLPFHPELPTWAMDAGADLCVTSVHKMGSGFEQGSVFHLQGDRITPGTLAARADLLGTTSPSVLLYAGLDGWRRQMVEQGAELLDQALTLAAQVRATLDGIDGVHVHGRDDFCGPGRGHDMDPLQVFVDVSELGVTGYQAADWLRARHRINLHVCDHRRVSAQFTYADDAASADRLVGALRDLSRTAGSPDGLEPADRRVEVPTPDRLRLEQAMLPRDAFFGPIESVPAEAAAGRVAAEMLTPYPPGIPAALPGERLDAAVVRYLRTGVAAGMVVPDAADGTLDTIRVAVEG
ncbi:putative amino acid decarboxylase [Actinacidiphila reveromycinica]|uniref:Putative amino acid decarboxylase n=1 Tax=Actinacidiphila reveromycinica TaxID=659352 RepID=A0A7U3UMT3_9ACTN|nr:aminotransferase class I/II-fold pyridoxal phosphate-dependent enzyme [Streptomyces sp. SN-593]BBA95429.1 putative amino acid decarboxylase [Streptomyces sp. SN-593]